MITTERVERWLREDLGHHDVTNYVPGDTEGRLVAKEGGVLAGVEAARAVFEYLDVSVTDSREAGDRIQEGNLLVAVEGPAREVLRGERVAVNLLGHAAGVATRTDRAVRRAREADDDVRVAGTRKTTPGLRGVEKRAIVAGGGDTHRLDLSHMVMIKENHVAEMGLESAIEHFQERKSFATKVEVEAETVDQARRAARAGADVVLLDNMDPDGVREGVAAVESVDDRTLVEASGGITLDTVGEYAATGVDVISMGSLTHSAPALDCSFRTG